MSEIPGYQIIAEIYESTNSLVYRGRRNQDGQPVILKLLKDDYPSPEEIIRYQLEYEITSSLNLPGVVQAYTLEKYHNSLLIVFEDFGGESLKIITEKIKFNLQNFLKIAIQSCESLGGIHQKNVMHKDINPSNIIFNLETGQVKIIDFGISTILTRENPTLRNPNVLEGTLAYMSPEQTGRMNRSMDYRTDFYSLGATFYELLAHQRPFDTEDAMELVHCHIAKQPVSPRELNPEIPQPVSDIVLKLLAKTAEDRYQSAWGIKADLEECLNQLQHQGKIADFTLAQHDLSSKFQIPQKLYGREREVETLLQAFVRVASPKENRVSDGQAEMMLVAGYSGMGKSALVQEIYKPITSQRGYFISGKFDQFQRNIPYYAAIKAVEELVSQLLTESQAHLQQWREKILAAVGSNGQIIIEALPSVELIVGKQPPVPALAPTESQNRFNLVFQNFIRVFTQAEHPLVIFLDDLQWADSASLKLIELMMRDRDMHYLFLIGAYRDNEVSAVHPLMLMLEELQKIGVTVSTISLAPLDLGTLNQLITETLHSELKRDRPLAELVFEKTQGNPFFVSQFLQYLYEEEALLFDFQRGSWDWNIEQIQRMTITDNVVELMVSKIQKLPSSTQQVLQLAACIGNPFDLNTLSLVNEASRSQTAADLWVAVQEGLVLLIEGNMAGVGNSEEENAPQDIFLPLAYQRSHFYKFLHDRVQQAAYSLISDAQKKAYHLKVGYLLLNNSGEADREEKIFDIVNHLNKGAELISDRHQRKQLAELNLTVGQKAKTAAAYEAAVKYLTASLELLPADSWQNQYELTLKIHIETAEAEYLNTNFERSEMLTECVWQQATNLLDKAKAAEIKTQLYMAKSEFLKAIDAGLSMLKMLEIPLEIFSISEKDVEELARIATADTIVEISDPYKLIGLSILTKIASPAMSAKPEMMPSLILTSIKLSIKHGHSALSAFAYAQYGMLLCGIGDVASGYLAYQIALKLLEKFNAKHLKAKVYTLFNYLRYWKDHIRETKEPLLEAVQSGLETGDIEFASYSLMNYCTYIFFMGEPLEWVEQQQSRYIELGEKLKQETPLAMMKIGAQLIHNLLGRTVDKYSLIGDRFDEAEMVPVFQEKKYSNLLFCTFFAKSILCYLEKDYKAAIANASLAAENLLPVIGWMAVFVHQFYYSLALLADYPTADNSEQQKYLDIVEENQQKLRACANTALCNFQHKYDLVEAEKYRVFGQNWEAMEYYDRAIKGAREERYIQDEALAYERAAEFYFINGREEIAKDYMTKAHYAYVRWGATTKVQQLKSRYPQLISRKSGTDRTGMHSTISNSSVTGSSSSASLDLATAIKASQTLSSEIMLDKLLTKLMKILIENAGAQKGFLILETKGKLLIEAEGTVDRDRVTVLQSIPVGGEYSVPLPVAIVNYVARSRRSVVLSNAAREGKFTNDPYIIEHKPKSILCAPLLDRGKLNGIVYLENNLTADAFTPDRLEILNLLSSQSAISIENARFYKNVADLNVAYSRFVPREFLQFLDKESIVDVKLGDNVQKEMSVLFSDIRSFTTLSESMTPEDNFKFINAYLSRMEPSIIKNRGFIDKYIGDAIMALFSGEADDAVKAGIAMLHTLVEYNKGREKAGYLPIQIGIGINTGSLMLGTVGGHNRMDGTVISDAVNLASRVESLTKEYGVSLLITQETFSNLQNPNEYAIRFIDRVKVKGKSELVTVFEVFDGDVSEVKDLKLVTKTTFEKALLLYNMENFGEAAQLLQECLRRNPNDKASQIYRDRCKQHLSQAKRLLEQ